MAGAATATAKVPAQQQQQQASSTQQATEEQLPLWREVVIGAALGYFVGSILLATVLYIATAVLIITSPTSPWGWTIAAVVVGGLHNSVSIL
jgi:Mg/Co/Ni transporter MgtE